MIDTSTPIAPGAQPFVLPGGPIGILVVHGYGGSIGDYRSFAEQLHRHAYTVSGMRLAGHGQGIDVLAKSDMYDWRESVFTAARQLGQQSSQLFLVGASFGGDLAVDYAAHATAAVSGLVLINTPLAHRRAKRKRAGLAMLRFLSPNLPKMGLSPADKQKYAELGSTTAWPISGLLETDRFLRIFVVPALPRIHTPTLVMKNAGDTYVAGKSAVDIYHALHTADKHLITIPGHTHRPFRDPVSVEFMAKQVHAFIQSTIAKKTK